MSNEELYNDILKLEIMVSDLKSIVLGQCATILNLMDENREIKRILERENKNIILGAEQKNNYCLITALENMQNRNYDSFKIKEEE